MSSYARNHLQDDWAAIAAADAAVRLHEAERTAAWYFDRATRRPKAAYEAALCALRGATGHKRDADGVALRQRWQNATIEAQALFDATVACLLVYGEVSGDLDDAWTELFAREAGGTAVPTAHCRDCDP